MTEATALPQAKPLPPAKPPPPPKAGLHTPTAKEFVFSLKLLIAAVFSMWIVFSENLLNPYWSIMNVFIVASAPEAGAIRSKGLFRLVGTALGAVIVIMLTGLFADKMAAQLASYVAALAVILFIQQSMIRSPANYLWSSVAITVGVTGVASLASPTGTFLFTVGRVEETVIGVLCLLAVDSFIMPTPLAPGVIKSVETWRDLGRKWVGELVAPASPDPTQPNDEDAIRAGLRNLMAAVTAVDAKAVQLPFDTGPVPPLKGDVDLMRYLVVSLIADMAAITTWVRAAHDGAKKDTELFALMQDIGTWTARKRTAVGPELTGYLQDGESLIERLLAVAATGAESADQETLIERGAASRLAEFLRRWMDLEMTLHAVESRYVLPKRLSRGERAVRPIRNVDYLLSLFNMFPLLVVSGAVALLWYWTAWSDGPVALALGTIACTFLAGQATVLKAAGAMLISVVIAAVITIVLLFVVLPRVTAFPVLVGVLAVLIIPLGLLLAQSPMGTIIGALTFVLLAVQPTYSADFASRLLMIGGSIAGLLIAAACLYICNYDRAQFSGRRLLRVVRRDIAELARGPRTPDRNRYLQLTVDRLAQFATATATMDAKDPLVASKPMNDLRIGLDVMALRSTEPLLSKTESTWVRGACAAIADAFQEAAKGPSAPLGLKERLDAALTGLEQTVAGPAHARAVDALLGVRLALSGYGSPDPSPSKATGAATS